MSADDQATAEEPTVNVISLELAHQLAADRSERLRRRFRRPFERPALVRSVVGPRGDGQ
jgi:hypothetical protein